MKKTDKCRKGKMETVFHVGETQAGEDHRVRYLNTLLNICRKEKYMN